MKPPDFTLKDAEFLKRFLTSSAVPDGTLSYFSTAGLLFAVACCPEFIRPSEWMPAIFDGKEVIYETFEDAEKVSTALLGLYNLINEQVRAGDPQLPPGCVLYEAPLDNLEREAPLNYWSVGFVEGHRWLSKIWEGMVPEDVMDDFGAMLLTLYFFASRPVAEKMWMEIQEQDMTFGEMTAVMLGQFGDTMKGYAALGMALAGRVSGPGTARTGPHQTMKTGRNEPCPCGSGKSMGSVLSFHTKGVR